MAFSKDFLFAHKMVPIPPFADITLDKLKRQQMLLCNFC